MDRGLRGEWGKAAKKSGLPLGGGVPSLERGERRPLFTMATSTSRETNVNNASQLHENYTLSHKYMV